MCIKHEHKEHQVITWCEIVGFKDKDATKSKVEVLEVKPNAVDQSKSKEMKQSKSWHSVGNILKCAPVVLKSTSGIKGLIPNIRRKFP